MDKERELSTYSHSVSIIERKNILITGVKKVDSFDSEEFLIETIMGYLALKGQDLELVKLDTLQGSVTIKGMVNSFDYIEDTKSEDKTAETPRFKTMENLFFIFWYNHPRKIISSAIGAIITKVKKAINLSTPTR